MTTHHALHHLKTVSLLACLLPVSLPSIADTSATFYMTPQTHKFEMRASGYCTGKLSGSYQPAPGNIISLAINSANHQLSNITVDTIYLTSQNAVLGNVLTLNESLVVSAKNGKFSAKARSSALFNMVPDIPNATVNSAFRCKGGETFSSILAAGKSLMSTGSVTIAGNGGNYTYSVNGKQKRGYLVKPNCNEQGLLSNHLANIAAANYTFNCSKPAKVTLNISNVSKGAIALP